VGFLVPETEPGWRAANTSSFTETAVADGIDLQVLNANGSPATQLTQFQTLIADPRINVIVLAPFAGTTYDDALKAARAVHKLVVVEGGYIAGDPSLYVTRVASDYTAEGKMAGDAMCALLNPTSDGATATPNAGPSVMPGGMRGNVVEISSGADPYADGQRTQGFLTGIQVCGATMVQSRAGATDAVSAEAAMNTFLAGSRDIQGVFAHGDAQAIGAVAAIGKAGLKAGKDVQVVDIGGTADGFKALIAGDLGAMIDANPLLAPQAYQAALDALNGVAVPKWIQAQDSKYLASQGADTLPIWCACHKY
jgi:simple sugar transport system substrate-binding protein